MLIKELDYYIFNDKGDKGIKNHLTVDGVYENLDFISDEGFVVIGVNYVSDIEDKGVGAIDYIMRKDTDEDFVILNIDNAMEDKEALSVIKEELKQLDELVNILNKK